MCMCVRARARARVCVCVCVCVCVWGVCEYKKIHYCRRIFKEIS